MHELGPQTVLSRQYGWRDRTAVPRQRLPKTRKGYKSRTNPLPERAAFRLRWREGTVLSRHPKWRDKHRIRPPNYLGALPCCSLSLLLASAAARRCLLLLLLHACFCCCSMLFLLHGIHYERVGGAPLQATVYHYKHLVHHNLKWSMTNTKSS